MARSLSVAPHHLCGPAAHLVRKIGQNGSTGGREGREHLCGHLTKSGSRDDLLHGTVNGAVRMLLKIIKMTNGGTEK